MNAMELSELLNELPDQMIVSAYSHSRTGKNPASADNASGSMSKHKANRLQYGHKTENYSRRSAG